jgi:hypothetical protein
MTGIFSGINDWLDRRIERQRPYAPARIMDLEALGGALARDMRFLKEDLALIGGRVRAANMAHSEALEGLRKAVESLREVTAAARNDRMYDMRAIRQALGGLGLSLERRPVETVSIDPVDISLMSDPGPVHLSPDPAPDEVAAHKLRRHLESGAEDLGAASWEYSGFPRPHPMVTYQPEWGDEREPLILIEEGLEDSGALEFAVAVVAAFGRGELVFKDDQPVAPVCEGGAA